MNADFIRNLRLNQIFGGGQPEMSMPPPMEQPMTPQPMAPQPFDVGARMGEIYQPQTQATDRFNSLIENTPQYENPSFLRTIAASLSAFGPGGHKTGEEVMNWHNNKNQQEWKQQIVPAQQAADNERQENVNNRTLAHQTVTNELRARADADKNVQNEKMNAIRKQRADVYEFKAKNPNMKIISPPGGNIIAVDPTNPNKVITLTDQDGNPISSGSLSETDKINLQHENAMEKVDTQIQGQKEVENIRQSGREQLVETRGWKIGSIPDPNDPAKQIGVQYNEATGEVKPISFGNQNPVITTPSSKPTGPGANVNLEAIQNKTRETLQAVNDLIDEEGNLKPHAADAVGKSRILGLQYVPGSQTKKGDVDIKALKAKLVVDLIGEMKAQSKTGATGFGALNLRELGVLENAASKLDPTLDEASFAAELKRIRDRLNMVLQPADGFTDTRTVKPKTKKTLEQLKKEYKF
jgi:hypothetical protein